MPDSDTVLEYKQGFMCRVKAARRSRKLKQWEIAEALGMPQDKYKQYEVRSLLPHHLMARFCIICKIDPEWLITGHGKMASKEIPLPEPTQSRTSKPRAKKAA